MGPGTLNQILAGIKVKSSPNLLVGFATADDAGVYQLTPDKALIQTVDFFTPMIDDPFSFGQIAAANALSDVYAMGGEPLTAMNIVCFPSCLDIEVLKEIIRGGLSKIEEAGALLIGGHTVDDNEPKYGLAVTGLVDPQRVILNTGARAGDYLYLTKPLGTGIISTGIKGEMADRKAVTQAILSMSCLNKAARDVMVEVGVHAATDVTGFGLLGHLAEMMSNNLDTEIWVDKLPVLESALELAEMGLIPGGAYANRDYLEHRINFYINIDDPWRDILLSPETSGGLLMAVAPDRRSVLEKKLAVRGVMGAGVGRVLGQGKGKILVMRSDLKDGEND